VKRVVPQSWGTSNSTFVTNKVGNIEISFVEYSASKKVRLQLDIVEYSPGDQTPRYDLIMGKQIMHDLGVKLDFQEKTITIDKILLAMRNIANLQLRPRITRALRENTCFAQEPISTRSATNLVGICRMSACRPEVQNVRHEMSGPTCRRHVGQHVGDMVQKYVAEGTDMTHQNVGFCDMSAPCRRMHKT
jgi:hypothetical protein